MFLTEVVDIELWQSMQDNFADLIGFPLSTIDISGNILFQSGKFPFFCDLVKKKGEKYCHANRAEIFKELSKMSSDNFSSLKFSCHAGLINLVSPVFIKKELVGAFLCSSIKDESNIFGEVVKAAQFIKIGSDELLDELPNFKKLNNSRIEELGKSLCLMSKTLPHTCFEKKNLQVKFKNSEFLLDLSNSLNNILDLNKVLDSGIKLISKMVNAYDCSITLFTQDSRLKSDDEFLSIKQYIEKNNFTQVKNTKTAIFIKNALEDFILKGIEGISNFERCIFTLPLISGSNLLGILTLYFPVSATVSKKLIMDCADILAIAITNSRKLQSSHASAITDSLTGLYNKGYFSASLENEIARAKNFKRATSLILFDIDNFKQYNDSYGHPAGDTLLKQLGKLLKENIGAIDTACRYGGEEFAIILPETKPEHAFMLAEKVRMTIANFPFENKKTTISIGLATCLNSSVSAEELIKESDKALYRAKNSGRNKTRSTIIVDKNLNPIDVQEASHIKKII